MAGNNYNLSESVSQNDKEYLIPSYEKLTKFQDIDYISIFKSSIETFKNNGNYKSYFVNKKNKLPILSKKSRFKYSHYYDGCLFECKTRFDAGENITIIYILKNSIIASYAITSKIENWTNIEIIDVDVSFRRSNGLYQNIMIGDSNFSIGIGHLLVYELIAICDHPLLTDATNDSSKYIFSSLGFIHFASSNPNILKLL